jgi:hypothetical protein
MDKMVVLFAIFAVILFSNRSFGDDSKTLNSGSAYSRLCDECDLCGLWRVVKWIPYMEIKGADWRKTMFLRHQWMEFNGEGHLRTLAANKKMKLKDVLERLSKAPWGVKIKFKRRGFCEISSESEKFPDALWRCVVITKNIKLPKQKYNLSEGDVIMTLLDDDENILYFRLLRKIPDTLFSSP